jgi:hypothetical protein
LRQVAGWPAGPGQEVLEKLVTVLNAKIEKTPSEEERGRLRRFRDAALSLGQDLASDVLAKVLTEGR